MDFRTEIRKIQNGNGEIYGEAVFPETTRGKIPFVVFSHGFNGSYTDFRPMKTLLARNGIGSYSFDFCGGSLRSKSSLKMTEMTIGTEEADLFSVIDEAARWNQVDAARLYAFGASMGGFVTALAAGERLFLRGLFLLYPALCIPDDWRGRFPAEDNLPGRTEIFGCPLGVEFVREARSLDAFRTIGRFQNEVLIYHGDSDSVVPLAYSRRAQEVCPRCTLRVFEGEGHGFSEEGNRIVAEDMLSRILADKG